MSRHRSVPRKRRRRPDVRRSVFGYIDLPASILTRGNALGRTYRLSVGGYGGFLALPGRTRGRDDILVQPKAAAEIGKLPLSDGSVWGIVLSSPDIIAAVLNVFVSFPITSSRRQKRDADRLADHVRGQLPQWFTRLTDWLEVLTGQDLGWTEPYTTTDIETGRLQLRRWRRGKRATVGGHPPVEAIVESRDVAATSGQWQRAIAAASQAIDVPVERLLLRDAARALMRGQARRSVIDSGTAAELALRAMVMSHLSNVPSAVTDVMLDRRTLGGLATLGRRLNVAGIPSALTSELIEPRNRAAHMGYAPTRGEARHAWLAARELVNRAVPLPH